MSRADALVELGQRYAALGLSSAARAVFLRAHKAGGDSPSATRRLAELALASGDGRTARDLAKQLCESAPGPTTRLLLGQAQLVDGEFAAARLSFAAVLEVRDTTPLTKARALVGRSLVAALERDDSGAAATALAAFDEFLGFARAAGRTPQEVERSFGLVEEIAARLIAADAAEQASERLLEVSDVASVPVGLVRAALLEAQRAHGDAGVDDAAIEAALLAELARHPASRPARLKLAERRLRRRFRDSKARNDALAQLRGLIDELCDESTTAPDNVMLARAYFLLAGALEDDPAHAAEAERAYCEGLRLRPGHAASANRLALLYLSRGDVEAAAEEVERALVVDATGEWTWRNAARVVDAMGAGAARQQMAQRLLRAGLPATADDGAAATRLLAAAGELATSQTLAGVHERGHRLKNLLGIAGSRARKARKLADGGPVAGALSDLERDFTALFDEWADFLRTMKATAPTLEVVDVRAMLREVVAAATERGSVPIRLDVEGNLPDVRGDRSMLREAMLNVAVNAVEACADGGDVEITARASALLGGRALEICVRDSGAGIGADEMGSVMAAGVTSKPSGSGLGLAITARVVAAHHGRVTLESEHGRGTTVTTLLPTDLAGFVNLARFSVGQEGVS